MDTNPIYDYQVENESRSSNSQPFYTEKIKPCRKTTSTMIRKIKHWFYKLLSD